MDLEIFCYCFDQKQAININILHIYINKYLKLINKNSRGKNVFGLCINSEQCNYWGSTGIPVL